MIFYFLSRDAPYLQRQLNLPFTKNRPADIVSTERGFHSSLSPFRGKKLLLLHLVDDNLYVGSRYLAVVVQVVLHVLTSLRLLHLVDDNLYVSC